MGLFSPLPVSGSETAPLGGESQAAPSYPNLLDHEGGRASGLGLTDRPPPEVQPQPPPSRVGQRPGCVSGSRAQGAISKHLLSVLGLPAPDLRPHPASRDPAGGRELPGDQPWAEGHLPKTAPLTPLRAPPHLRLPLEDDHPATLVARGQQLSRVVELDGGDDVGWGGRDRKARLVRTRSRAFTPPRGPAAPGGPHQAAGA